jgi:uncharacterized membrane protein YeaQ/YmgE (transglycosylase-associated protein family)
MGLIFLIVVGGTLGWLATIVLRAETVVSVTRNAVVGIGGALASGLGLTPLVAEGDLLRGSYSVDALIISLVGAGLLLCAVNLLLRRHESR